MTFSRLALLATAFTTLTATAAAAAPLEPIAVARHQALGTTVTVVGTVIVPTDAFDGGFAIQGLVDGIYVLDSAGHDLRIGDHVETMGVLTDNFGLLSIQPTRVHKIIHALPVLPFPTRTGAVGEATEGRLLHLHGTMVGDLFDDGDFGFKLDIDDGSGPIQIFLFPHVIAKDVVPTLGLVPGAEISVSCFSNQFEAFFECDPPAANGFRVE
jgi:hypothetical protein